MANLTAKWIPLALLIFTIFLSFLITSESRILQHGSPSSIQKNFDSQLFLSKLGFDPSTLETYRRRSLIGEDRVAPAGPNSQHNSQPPSNKLPATNDLEDQGV